ncbi:MAG: GNAT family N-acetyltransferase [Bacillota bacterium]
MNIMGRKVFLRALETSDMEALRSYHNDPEIAKMVMGWSFPISLYEQERWYERTITDPVNKRFAIDAGEHGFIGISTLTDMDMKYRSAFHGIMIGAKNIQGKGYGTDAVMATMRYAFEELGLERLDSEIVEFNQASLRLYTQKCGWTIEGTRRHSVFRSNTWYDSHVVGIIRDDYLRLVEKTRYWD